METTAASAAAPDWSALPADLLQTAMSSLEVPDIVRAGAVCTSWRSAYAAFRALRLPTPWQAPCLLYCAHAGRGDPCTPTLYSPSTGASFRVPLLEPCGDVICSAHGWLLVTDMEANPYLLNPLTGARAALPPVTMLERVKSRFVDEDGGVAYNVDHDSLIQKVTARSAIQQWMFHQAAISGSPGGGASSCVVLIAHRPYGELSFARPGDDRWTSLSHLFGPTMRSNMESVVYNEEDSLFYVLGISGSLHALDLNDASSPVAWLHAHTLERYCVVWHTMHLVGSPSCGGGVLMATLTKNLRRSGESPEEEPCPRNGISRLVLLGNKQKHKYVFTTDVQMHRIGKHGVERLAGSGDHALFLGRRSALYHPVERLPTSLSKRDGAYLTVDVATDMLLSRRMSLEVLSWDFESGTLQKLGDNARPLHPWFRWAPIWITPSLC